jgi:hypothetical protein
MLVMTGPLDAPFPAVVERDALRAAAAQRDMSHTTAPAAPRRRHLRLVGGDR